MCYKKQDNFLNHNGYSIINAVYKYTQSPTHSA